jgi:hypothetical protein
VLLYRVGIELDLQPMREGGKTKAKVLEDIESRGEHADARPILREYVERLSMLHEIMRRKLAQPLEDQEALIEGAIDRFEAAFPDEAPVGEVLAIELGTECRCMNETALFKKMIERRRHFLRRNPSLVNLTRRHVSSEPSVEK